MNKAIGKILAIIIGLLLLIYTATRSYHFIAMTLPENSEWLAWCALAALDGGLVAWLLVFRAGSEGSQQRAIAFIMTIVDLVGAATLAGIDAMYTTGDKGMAVKMSQQDMTYAVLALSAIILINVAALVFFELGDPDVRKKAAHEEAKGVIDDMAIKQLDEAAPRLAAELVPEIAQAWMGDMRSQYQAKLNIFDEKRKTKQFTEMMKSAVEAMNGKPEPKPVRQAQPSMLPLQVRRNPPLSGSRQLAKPLALEMTQLNMDTQTVELASPNVKQAAK